VPFAKSLKPDSGLPFFILTQVEITRKGANVEGFDDVKRPTLVVLHDGRVEAEATPRELFAEISGEELPTECVRECYHAINTALREFRPADSTDRMLWAGLKAMRDELIAQRPSLVPELLH
jgi:hypothetical protein